jgi:hypothetical protein
VRLVEATNPASERISDLEEQRHGIAVESLAQQREITLILSRQRPDETPRVCKDLEAYRRNKR